MQCAERGRHGERTVADLVDGMALRAMDAHEGQAALRRRRLGENGTARHRKKRTQRDDEPWDATKRLLYHLIRTGFNSSPDRQCQERGRVGAIFLPSRIGRVVCELVAAPAFASTDCAYALKIAHDLRVGVRDFLPIEVDLVHPPIQQIRGVRPFAGENGEIGSANAYVAGDAFRLGRTATVKVHHRPASAVPASPPMRKQLTKAGPFTCFEPSET